MLQFIALISSLAYNSQDKSTKINLPVMWLCLPVFEVSALWQLYQFVFLFLKMIHNSDDLTKENMSWLEFQSSKLLCTFMKYWHEKLFWLTDEHLKYNCKN